ncbi:MAG: hypothetical protein IJ828_09535 [Treponema sp.]|nr:hypothetical protein [Treponema sp.]
MINYILIGIIAAYSIFIVRKVIHNYEEATKEKTSLGCYSCSAHKNGICTNHACSAEKNIDNMIKQAKINLNHKDKEAKK